MKMSLPIIVAAGRGATMSLSKTVETVLSLAKGKKVVYLGTATFDEDEPMERQCKGLREASCEITALKVSERNDVIPDESEIRDTILSASIILVSGGNTLYAVQRWKDLGIDKLIHQAAASGAVLCGGSAGAICWFDHGHSQSLNPALSLHVDPDLTEEEKKDWEYIRVDGLGFLPGLCVPHHDVAQSNGVPRTLDSNEMMKENPDQPCIGIDEEAILVVEGTQARVLSAKGDATCYVKVCEDSSVDGETKIISYPFTEEDGQIPIENLLDDPAAVLDEPEATVYD